MDLLTKVVTLETEAADFGFQWETTSQILSQIKSECQEIEEQLQNPTATSQQQALQEEIGDLLHAVFSLCVFCQFDPKDTLSQTLDKFEKRLQAVKAIAAKEGLTDLQGQSFERLMQIWEQAKSKTALRSTE